MRRVPLLALAATSFAPLPLAADPPPPKLVFPLACVIGRTCEVQTYVDHDPGPGARDYRCGSETNDQHSGTDIRLLDMAAQRAGVDVLAAAAGRVSRLRDGVPDISVKAAGAASVANQECGNGVVIDHGDGWETQYCHLAKGSIRVKIGDQVGPGQPIARVGLSGNTEYPHMHLTVRHGSATVDPFAPSAAPGACDPAARPDRGLWGPDAAAAMSYKPGLVLNAGFAGAAVTPEAVEDRSIVPAGANAQALVAYVRAINLQAGDVRALVLRDGSGAVVAQSTLPALETPKAQMMMFVGAKRPAGGWKPGVYVATFTVTRNGGVVIAKTLQMRL